MYLRIVTKNEDIVKSFKTIYKTVIENFQEFLIQQKLLNTQQNNVTNLLKGKPTEYPRFLIYSLVLYTEIFNDDSISLDLSIIYKKIKSLESIKNFEDFNRLPRHNGFYQATIKSFKLFLNYVQDIDNVSVNLNSMLFEKTLIHKPTKRKIPIKTNYGFQYPRNVSESIEAKKNANWLCEIDETHTTFVTGTNLVPYMESHHLIPLSAQIYFEYTIDFADNIVSLCPNCHRKIHYAMKEEQEEMLLFLFKKRMDKYQKYGIIIDFITLLNFYK